MECRFRIFIRNWVERPPQFDLRSVSMCIIDAWLRVDMDLSASIKYTWMAEMLVNCGGSLSRRAHTPYRVPLWGIQTGVFFNRDLIIKVQWHKDLHGVGGTFLGPRYPSARGNTWLVGSAMITVSGSTYSSATGKIIPLFEQSAEEAKRTRAAIFLVLLDRGIGESYLSDSRGCIIADKFQRLEYRCARVWSSRVRSMTNRRCHSTPKGKRSANTYMKRTLVGDHGWTCLSSPTHARLHSFYLLR
jgi:hypothetical protein